jgi:hypothetical protein
MLGRRNGLGVFVDENGCAAAIRCDIHSDPTPRAGDAKFLASVFLDRSRKRFAVVVD